MCQPGTMEVAMKDRTSPLVDQSLEGTGTHFAGPNTLFFSYSFFYFRGKGLSRTGRGICQDYPNCFKHHDGANRLPWRILLRVLKLGNYFHLCGHLATATVVYQKRVSWPF
jgi:hypothetical protein